MRRWPLVVFLGTTVCLGGCAKNKTTVAYSPDAWRIVPIVRPGEIFELRGLTPDWYNGDNPCVDGRSSPCEIRKNLTGKLYGYTCKEGDCDPEIAVDDPGGVIKATANGPGGIVKGGGGTLLPPTHVIKIACVSGTTKIDDTEVHTGETIGWGAYGSGVQAGWKVNIAKQADLCREADSPIQSQMICTVKALPTASFTYYVTDACASQQSTPPLINVKER